MIRSVFQGISGFHTPGPARSLRFDHHPWLRHQPSLHNLIDPKKSLPPDAYSRIIAVKLQIDKSSLTVVQCIYNLKSV